MRFFLVIVVIASKEIYKANAYQFNVYKRRLMGEFNENFSPVLKNSLCLVRRPEEVPIEYRPFCS